MTRVGILGFWPGAIARPSSQPAAIEKMVVASGGYDVPSFANIKTLKTWAEEGPPKGTLYHYPNPHNHQVLSVAAAPSPLRSPSRFMRRA